MRTVRELEHASVRRPGGLHGGHGPHVVWLHPWIAASAEEVPQLSSTIEVVYGKSKRNHAENR